MRRSRHQRNAVRVLPVPVGARIRVESPRAIAGQPSRCGAVTSSKTARNHWAVMGWKSASGSAVAGCGIAVAVVAGAADLLPGCLRFAKFEPVFLMPGEAV